ncbi:MAG: hypothetical protein HUJ70_13635 [Pseudobutyrivibrio sp.]|nr:hypothetical protein [Pseudobutyrivibrio sp.]
MNFAEDEMVLCGASCYTKKYYLNDNFENLPQSVKDELKIMCVIYTEEVSGTITLVFDGEGELQVFVDHNDDDFYYDEIGSALKVKEMQRTKRELFEQLETYYKVVFLGEGLE